MKASEKTLRDHLSELGSAVGTLGEIIAITISWSVNHSVGWAVCHGVLAWIYVIYYAVMR